MHLIHAPRRRMRHTRQSIAGNGLTSERVDAVKDKANNVRTLKAHDVGDAVAELLKPLWPRPGAYWMHGSLVGNTHHRLHGCLCLDLLRPRWELISTEAALCFVPVFTQQGHGG